MFKARYPDIGLRNRNDAMVMSPRENGSRTLYANRC